MTTDLYLYRLLFSALLRIMVWLDWLFWFLACTALILIFLCLEFC